MVAAQITAAKSKAKKQAVIAKKKTAFSFRDLLRLNNLCNSSISNTYIDLFLLNPLQIR